MADRVTIILLIGVLVYILSIITHAIIDYFNGVKYGVFQGKKQKKAKREAEK